MNNKYAFRIGAGLLVTSIAVAIAMLIGANTITGTGQDVTIKDSTLLIGNFGRVIVSGVGSEAKPILIAGGKMKYLELSGQYIIATGHTVTGAQDHAVFIPGKHILFQYSDVYGNVLENKSGTLCGNGSWGSAVKVYVGGEDIAIRGNQIHENCGEGIGVTRGVDVTVSDNYVWDNYGNIYVDNSNYVEVTANTVYCRNHNYYRDGSPAFGIGLGAETYTGWGNQLYDIQITHNVVDGCKPTRLYSEIGAITPPNVTISNNIFVNVPQPYVSVRGAVQSNNVTGLQTVVPATPLATPTGTIPSITFTRTFTLAAASSTPTPSITRTVTLSVTSSKTPTPTASTTKTPTQRVTVTNISPEYSATFTFTPTLTPTITPSPMTCPTGWFIVESPRYFICLWQKGYMIDGTTIGYPPP